MARPTAHMSRCWVLPTVLGALTVLVLNDQIRVVAEGQRDWTVVFFSILLPMPLSCLTALPFSWVSLISALKNL